MTTNNIFSIYVKLTNEDVDVWRPVKAKRLEENIFEILDRNNELSDKYGERWEFNFRDIVECDVINNSYYAIKLLGSAKERPFKTV